MVKWIPSMVAALVALLGVFAVPVQDYIAAHPGIAAVVAGIATVVAHLMPSPRK